MALKKENIKALLKLAKAGKTNADGTITPYTDAEIDTLIADTEEKEAAIPEGIKVLNTQEYTTLTENVKNDGIKIGKELQIKELKEKTGVEVEGKNPEKFIDAFKAKVEKESGTSVDEKVKQRDKTISDMKTALEKVTSERDNATTQLTQKEKDGGLIKHFPKNRDDRFSDSMYLSVLKGEYEFTEEDGKEVVKKNGEVLKDDKFNNLTKEAVINSHFTTSKWIKADEGDGDDKTPSGRGGGNKGGGGKMTFVKMSEFQSHLDEQGVHPGSEKATQLLNEAMKANPQMDLNT